MSPRHVRTPRSRRSWLVVALVAVGLVAVFLLLPTPGGNPTTIAQVPTAPSPGATNPQATDDSAKLKQFLLSYHTGYDCPANKDAKSVAQLKLCPDYTASVSFDTSPPTIVSPIAINGHKPFDVSVKPVHDCGNDGAQGTPVTCKDMWRVKWTVDSTRFVVLGYNQQSTTTVRSDGSSWTGPIGFNSPTGDMLISPTDTKAIEIYAGYTDAQSPGTPLTDDRQAPKS